MSNGRNKYNDHFSYFLDIENKWIFLRWIGLHLLSSLWTFIYIYRERERVVQQINKEKKKMEEYIYMNEERKMKRKKKKEERKI
jgi:hypothetical protein